MNEAAFTGKTESLNIGEPAYAQTCTLPQLHLVYPQEPTHLKKIKASFPTPVVVPSSYLIESKYTKEGTWMLPDLS